MRKFLLRLLILYAIGCPVNSHGEIFKCTDLNGRVVYSDTACDTQANRQAMDNRPKQEIARERSFFSVISEKIQGFIKQFTNNRTLNSDLSGNPLVEPKSYQCDGRTRCPQMTSCDEAIFFIRNCPNTEMDGDDDGTPCEKQWC
jgi:hypothetical protein